MSYNQLDAERYLREQGVLVDIGDKRSPLEIAAVFGFVALEAVEIVTDDESKV